MIPVPDSAFESLIPAADQVRAVLNILDDFAVEKQASANTQIG